MGTGRQFGDKIRYACSVGYYLDGAGESLCQASGNWSTSPPQCQGNVTPTTKASLFFLKYDYIISLSIIIIII